MRSPPGQAELPSLFTLPRGGLLGRRMTGRCKCTGSPSEGRGRAAGSKQEQRPGLRRGRGRRLRPGRQQGWARPRGAAGTCRARLGDAPYTTRALPPWPGRASPATLVALQLLEAPHVASRRRGSTSAGWGAAPADDVTAQRPLTRAGAPGREGGVSGVRTAPPRVRGALSVGLSRCYLLAPRTTESPGSPPPSCRGLLCGRGRDW